MEQHMCREILWKDILELLLLVSYVHLEITGSISLNRVAVLLILIPQEFYLAKDSHQILKNKTAEHEIYINKASP